MNKELILRIIKWSVAVAACLFLGWKIVTYKDYPQLWESMHRMGMLQFDALGLAILLMPVNMLLEAWRWKTLIPMSWREANRQVYYSKMAGLITPWRLGEYPARGLLMEENRPADKDSIWSEVLSMGAVASVTMTMAIVLAGILCAAFSPKVVAVLGGSYLYSMLPTVLILTLLFLYLPKVLRRWVQVNGALLWTCLYQSLIRLACWCVQLWLVLWALGAVRLDWSVLSQLPIYFMMITLTPNLPVIEVGVRGAWAIVLFGTMNAAVAGVYLWAINTLLPCLIALFLQKKAK